jgi:hypothetical protein
VVMVMHGNSFSLKSFPPGYNSHLEPIGEEISL